MGINIGSTSATGVWIGGGNNDIVREGLVFWSDSGQYKSYIGSGTSIYDLSGNDIDGTLTNGPTFSDGNIDFDGTNDYINFGDVASLEPNYNNNYTICAWFYLDGDSNGMIMSKAQSTGNYRGWYLYFSASTNYLYHALYSDTSPNNKWRNVTDAGVSTATWYYVCSTHQYTGGSGHTGKFYLNGVEVDSTEDSDTLGTNTTSGTVEPFSIGMRNTSSLPFNGKIPIVQMYDRILSESEVLYNFHANRGRFGI